MDLLMFIFVAVFPVISDGLIVHGPSGPVVAPLGSSVVLLCYVDELLVMEDLEVEWRRTDSETLVHLYQDGESRPEVQQQDYHDRAHFFTDQIQHGNFSLRLDNLRAEDEGRYTCRVYSQQGSGETVVQIKDVEHLLVSGSDESISVSVGEDVTLSCSVDSHITPEHIEEVLWRKTDGDILVLLFQNNETLPDSSDERYRDRVELFTAEIPKGNFSLRLKSVRTEDKGVYMCLVFAGGLSANATVVLEQLGFSILHTMVLILCITASGSALLLCFIIYCTSTNKAPSESAVKKRIRTLGYLHVFLPNIMMFVAFVLWGVTEGFLYETVSCCALYILRPLMLLYVAPYLEKTSGEALFTEIIIFIVVYVSVLMCRAWESVVHYAKSDKIVVLAVYGVMILFIVIGVIYVLSKKKEMPCHGAICNWIWDQLAIASGFIFLILPSLQFAVVYFAFGAARGGYYVSIAVPVFYFLSFSCLFKLQGGKSCLELLNKTAWIIYMFIMNTVMVIFYITIVTIKRDGAGWICMAIFHQALWMIAIILFIASGKTGNGGKKTTLNSTCDFTENHMHLDLDLTITFKKMLYVFGSVGVVVLNSGTLMTELILKTVNGERAVGDLRVIVFPSESLFAFSLLILLMFGPWISDMKCLQCFQEAARPLDIPVTRSDQNQDSQDSARSEETPTNGLNQHQKTTESHETIPLVNKDKEANRSDMTETVSVVSQT
uniref:Ig-like domain-containing protein n=1 Tax=Cyprinus carpio carpio TaxID=630221 RepID=A0A9J8C923_CYPCA